MSPLSPSDADMVNEMPRSEDHTALLNFLAPLEAQRLADDCQTVMVAVDEVVLTEGSPGDFMAFVISGKLAVKKTAAFPGRFILLAEIERGGMVGEGAVVCGDNHGATVVALEKSELLVLSREHLRRLISTEQVLALKLLTRIVQVTRQRLNSAGARLSWIL
ncbi:MAG: cyclic nucleotide-binding domain-containing protein [Desulfobulbaceae bacterium]|nr:MAG: cyclic nucleotide-binding domain-containing protein [Desulfobulbaceae bacterium]